MKGIILSGGSATRLRPCTKVTSKQLLPVYNRPMIYYPLNTLIKAGIKEILIIVAPERAGDYLNLLGSGKEFGVKFTYEIQDEPKGLAEAFIIGEKFIDEDNVTMILGDNIFEDDFSQDIKSFKSGGKVFAKKVHDPERFGIVEFDKKNKAISIEEKPKSPKSNYCVTGLYIYDSRVIEAAKSLKPSKRGELEITDLNNWYLEKGELEVAMVKGEWIDAGTFDSLLRAQNFAKEKMQDKMVI
ncbi:NTP transferase domain-containing protein [Patescibacteria group bacterium]|nr:spore coat protein [Candidatus Falkowbacteria bacterium]MBU3905813.1 NTP transferase domain-containing protein [Patescibacteria group bacterium]MBU4015392.1 NTP transferase domain-containing protein [Patescibacteria group bacterium]MBU4026008.1 NTP transferase domain-containing protein [Patescibacteria group bacterium]MBU4072910.1 NTP transferase domain-containing protein [Patescibacteria group bacterium]